MKLAKAGQEKKLYSGKIFEVLSQPMQAGSKTFDFEIVRRAPGIRLIILNDHKMLLTHEYRHELNGYDWRLPGGKVFDTLDEYNAHKSSA
ncbi:MAG: hypothetical protein ABIG95_01515 [Candidatus Woesearchaeota archaeon]